MLNIVVCCKVSSFSSVDRHSNFGGEPTACILNREEWSVFFQAPDCYKALVLSCQTTWCYMPVACRHSHHHDNIEPFDLWLSDAVSSAGVVTEIQR
jgi:hypothetical protein